ncbi:MAG: YihY/virulence factor BrkB family protein [Bacteroidota bacterium]|jgi:membrane protein|nr:MAG: ribonuclease BN [Bacteroidota bacterium]
MKKFSFYGRVFKETLKRWFDRDPFRSSTVIAYYSLFSLPGLLIILITAVGYVYGTEEVTDKIIGQIQGVVGTKVADDVRAIAAQAAELKDNTFAYIAGIAAILFGATGVFYHLQQSLNTIWEVKPKPKQRFLKLLRDRLFSFGIVLAIGFLLLISFAVSTLIAALSEWVTQTVSESLRILFHAMDIILSLSIITLLFAAIYKFLPDVKISWRHVWGGAIVTSLLFVIAKFALGLYFGLNDPGSAYGAAGSIILILLWSSYSGMILLLGAEFTHVHTMHTSDVIEISDYAVPMHDETELTYTHVDEDSEQEKIK